MLITFINATLISFVVMYTYKAYKAYCAGQKQAEHMLEHNTFYQVLGFLSHMRRDTHEQVWRRAGFTNAYSSHQQTRCTKKVTLMTQMEKENIKLRALIRQVQTDLEPALTKLSTGANMEYTKDWFVSLAYFQANSIQKLLDEPKAKGL